MVSAESKKDRRTVEQVCNVPGIYIVYQLARDKGSTVKPQEIGIQSFITVKLFVYCYMFQVQAEIRAKKRAAVTHTLGNEHIESNHAESDNQGTSLVNLSKKSKIGSDKLL